MYKIVNFSAKSLIDGFTGISYTSIHYSIQITTDLWITKMV